MLNTDDQATPKTVTVPQGGNATYNFALTPKTNGNWKLELLGGDKPRNVSDLKVSFNVNSTPAQCEVEFAVLVVTMSADAKAAGWTFANDIHIYSEQLDVNDSITKALSSNALTWTFNVTAKAQDASGDAETIDYGYIALLNGVTYIQPDPDVRVGRP